MGIREAHHSLPLLYSVEQAGQQSPRESLGVTQLSTSLAISPRTTWRPLRVVATSRCHLTRPDVKSLPASCSLLTPTCFGATCGSMERPPEHSPLPRGPGGHALEHPHPPPKRGTERGAEGRANFPQTNTSSSRVSSLSPLPVSPFCLNQGSPNQIQNDVRKTFSPPWG